MKRITAILLCLLMLAALATACSDGGAQEKKLVVLEDDFAAEEYAIGFRAEDYLLATEVQKHIDDMIEDGTAAEISEKWFEKDIVLKNPADIDPIGKREGDTSLSDVLDSGKLVMGLDDSFPPMGFRDENQEIVGFDIDLAEEVAKRMGVTLVLQPIEWSAKEMELDSKKIDVIWNGMTVLPERIENMQLSRPYIANRQVVVTLDNSGITDKAGLKDKIVAVQEGSSAVAAIEKETATYESFKEVVSFKDNVTALMDLKAGRVDAVVMDEIVARYYIMNAEH